MATQYTQYATHISLCHSAFDKKSNLLNNVNSNHRILLAQKLKHTVMQRRTCDTLRVGCVDLGMRYGRTFIAK